MSGDSFIHYTGLFSGRSKTEMPQVAFILNRSGVFVDTVGTGTKHETKHTDIFRKCV